MTTTAASPADLAHFVGRGATLRSPLIESLGSLETLQSSVLANSPDYGVSSNTLGAVDTTLGNMGVNERFVSTVHDALVAADVGTNGVVSIDDAAVASALASAGVGAPPGPVSVTPAMLFGTPPTSGFVDDPICAANGNFVHTDLDVAFPGRTAVLDVVRTYNSLAADTIGAFGPGWTSVFDLRLRSSGGGVVWAHLADGSEIPFVDDGDGVFGAIGPRQMYITIATAEQGGGWILHEGHTKHWVFDESGRLEGGICGVATLQVGRDAQGRVSSMSELRSGRGVRVGWSRDRVVWIEASDGRRAIYHYDTDGVLVRVERTAGDVHFGVDGRLITTVTDADGVRLAFNVYDSAARVIEQTNEMGRTTRYEYSEHGTTLVSDTVDGPRNAFTHDDRGNLTALVDGNGRAMRLTYDDRGNVTRVVDRTGAVTEYAYDERDNITSRTDPDGLGAAWEWDAHDRLVVETHRNLSRTRYMYVDDDRRPSWIVGPDGTTITVDIDEDGLPAEIIDADGVATRFEHDIDGQMVAMVDALGNRTEIAYDTAGLPIQFVDASGAVTRIVNDAGGRIVEALIGDATTRYAYTAAGRPLAATDAVGQSWRAAFADNGRLRTFTDGEGSTVEFEWDLFGNLETVVAPDGGRYGHVYDRANNLVGAFDPEGNTATRVLDGEARVVAVTDTADREWRRELDVLGRTVVSIAPDGGRTRYEYHFDGSIARVVHPDGTSVSTEVDVVGRVVAVIDETRARYEFEYTPAGRPAARLWPSGRIDRWRHDEAGRMVGFDTEGESVDLELDGLGRVIAGETAHGRFELELGANGDLVGASGPRGSASFELDAAGRVAEVVDGLGSSTSYAWDRRGQLVGATDAAGMTSSIDYDARGRLSASHAPNGDVTSFGYDPIGWMRSVTDPLGATTTTRVDPTGRALGVSLPDGAEIAYTLDAVGRRTGVAAGGVLDTTFTYDQRGRLTEALRVADGLRTHLDRDDAGRLTGVTGPSGTLGIDRDDDGLVTGWIQDGARVGVRRDRRGRIIGLDDPDLGVVDRPPRIELERDLAGRITSDSRGATYRYDEAGRLVESLDPVSGRRSFRYGPDGLLESESGPEGIVAYRRGFLGRIEAIAHADGTQTTLTYDSTGRRRAARRSSGAVTEYRWDDLGNLVGLDHTTADGDFERHSLTIDALGRPVAIDGAPVLWDDVLTGSPLRVGSNRYLYLDERHRSTSPDARWSEPPADPWGSEASGDLRTDPHVGFRNELSAFGLVWMGARVYDPATREFLSPDPLLAVVGRPGAAGAYSYGFLNPVNHLDPSGLQPVSIEQYDAIRKQQEQGRLGQAWEAIQNDPWGTLAMVGVAAVGVGLCFVPGGQAIGVGILIGVGASAIQGIATGTFDPRGVAITGALGAIPGGGTLRSAMLIGAGTGIAADGLTALSHGRAPDIQSMATSGLFGAGGGAVAHGISTRIGGAEPPVDVPSAPTTARFVVDSNGVTTDLHAPMPAPKVPLAIEAGSGSNPWADGSVITSRVVGPGGMDVNMAMGPGQPRPGGWATTDHVPDVSYVRNELAVTPTFKPQVSDVQTYHIPEGVRVQEGIVGPQVENGVTYPGGGTQVQILNNGDRSLLTPLGPRSPIH